MARLLLLKVLTEVVAVVSTTAVKVSFLQDINHSHVMVSLQLFILLRLQMLLSHLFFLPSLNFPVPFK